MLLCSYLVCVLPYWSQSLQCLFCSIGPCAVFLCPVRYSPLFGLLLYSLWWVRWLSWESVLGIARQLGSVYLWKSSNEIYPYDHLFTETTSTHTFCPNGGLPSILTSIKGPPLLEGYFYLYRDFDSQNLGYNLSFYLTLYRCPFCQLSGLCGKHC